MLIMLMSVHVGWTCSTFAHFILIRSITVYHGHVSERTEIQVVTPGARIGQPQFAEPWLNVATDGQNVTESYQDASSTWQTGR